MKTRLTAILFAIIMQSSCIWADTIGGVTIHLHYQPTNKVNGNGIPSRAPANHKTTLDITHNIEEAQLVLSDSSEKTYTYYIYNEQGEVVSQGILDFSTNSNISIDLSSYQSGIYCLSVTDDEYTYSGTFEIN